MTTSADGTVTMGREELELFAFRCVAAGIMYGDDPFDQATVAIESAMARSSFGMDTAIIARELLRRAEGKG